MRQPFRRYSFGLAERHGLIHPKFLYKILTPSEIIEWMAYDTSISPEWVKKYNEEKEEKRINQLSLDEQSALVRDILGGV